jgi:hypothetical protein
VTSLGAESELDLGDEGDVEFGQSSGPRSDLYEPIRYLFMIQGVPQSRRSLVQQIGRLVQRANNLATYRHFVLNDLREIRQASKHIRMRGQQLDALTKLWSDKRLEYSGDYRAPVVNEALERMDVGDNLYNQRLARLAEAVEGR